MRRLTFVEAQSPVDRLDQTLADCGLISFERWQDVLKLVFADDEAVIAVDALDH